LSVKLMIPLATLPTRVEAFAGSAVLQISKPAGAGATVDHVIAASDPVDETPVTLGVLTSIHAELVRAPFAPIATSW
jgi:hypothetical protein